MVLRVSVHYFIFLREWWTLRAHVRFFGTEVGINANVVVSELSHLSIIDTNNLGFLRSAESAPRDEVHNPEDDGGRDQRVREAGAAVSSLIAKLDPVVVNPTTTDDGDAIKSGNVLLSEKSGEEISDDTTDSMGREDIKWVIVVEDKLELGGEVAYCASDDTEGNRGGWTNESRSGGNGDETDDGTRAESDDRPLLLKAVILENIDKPLARQRNSKHTYPEHPGKSSDGGSLVGDDASVGSPQVGAESRSTVETEPTKPEEDSADDNVRRVVWLVGEAFSSIAASLAEVDRDSESSSSG